MVHAKKLFLLGGPPVAGKSYLMDKIHAGGLPGIVKALNLGDPEQLVYARAATLKDIAEPVVERLVLHYDFLGPFVNGKQEYFAQDALGLIADSDEVVFVTLWVPQPVLSKRIHERRVRETIAFMPKLALGKEGFSQQIHKLKRFKMIQDLYDSPERLGLQYAKWLTFCAQYPGRPHHVLVNMKNEETLLPIETWNEIQKDYKHVIRSHRPMATSLVM
ncbi:MAG: hypothetical protein SH809_21270 [Rhodothermales bacterium]|nr:hypothetical protein [Rhodothermales bacterium]